MKSVIADRCVQLSWVNKTVRCCTTSAAPLVIAVWQLNKNFHPQSIVPVRVGVDVIRTGIIFINTQKRRCNNRGGGGGKKVFNVNTGGVCARECTGNILIS